jgi:hypothetical protein
VCESHRSSRRDRRLTGFGIHARWTVGPLLVPGCPPHVYEIDNPANAADATIFISAGGDYEVNYSAPICVDSDFGVVFCPDPNVWGVLGEDSSPPIDNTSYQNNTQAGGCELINIVGNDLLITSCVSVCGPTPVEEATWGTVKALYR